MFLKHYSANKYFWHTKKRLVTKNGYSMVRSRDLLCMIRKRSRKINTKTSGKIYSLTNPPRRVIFSYGVLMSVGKVLMKKSWASHFENSLILIYLSWCFILIPRWNNFHKFVEAIPIATIVHSQTNPHWLIKIFSKAKPDCMDLFWGYIQLIDPDKFDMICDKIGRMKTL